MRAIASAELALPEDAATCTPLSEGICEAMGELGAAPVIVEASVQLPGTDVVELVFRDEG